ncbi:gliding motility-associated C-terminal domain-containing protein [Runella limosa]|uniref:gliding motility-associated C-terminal domain-containing protein n=1 Tax=Runella limosa TaxID=370978 RepID=UPI0004033535|nr:T9SS C-terminal target domain-containing protein [Runella limosa]
MQILGNNYRKIHSLLRLLIPSKWSILCLVGWYVGLGSTAIFAQQLPDNQCDNVLGVGSGDFSISSEIGCAPFTVKVQNTQAGSIKSRYIYDYKGGNPNATSYKQDTTKNFTYTKAGVYTIMQLSESAQGQSLRACRQITIQDVTPPDFKVVPCENGKVTLTITNQTAAPYDEYVIEWGDGNIAIINRLNLTIDYQYPNAISKQITVQGRSLRSLCGGKSSKVVVLEIGAKLAKLDTLEILDATTAEIRVSNPNAIELELFRQEGAGTFVTTGTVFRADGEKVKVLVDTTKIFCYRVKPRASCIASLESNVLCVNFLKVAPTLEANIVSVSPYRRPTEVSKMTLVRNETPWWNPSITELYREDNSGDCNKQSCYRLQIDTRSGTILSNKVCVDAPPVLCVSLANVFIPDAFSPNGDGVNDLFEIKADPTTDVQVTVYDRWGAPVFQSTANQHFWNGSINGQPLPVGLYTYAVKVTDKVGRTFVKRGPVSLFR